MRSSECMSEADLIGGLFGRYPVTPIRRVLERVQ